MARRTPAAPQNIDQVAARRKHRAVEEQHWQGVIDRAAALHGLDYTAEKWPELSLWYETIPKGLPSRRDRSRWFREQQVLASLRESARATEGLAS